jgi:DNA-binding transcriptional LysR family regulator
MLDLHRLKLLREVDARGTVHGAARALDYTPSAISQQLAVLEREAGAKLLERSGRNVRLTEAGRVLVGHAALVLLFDCRGHSSVQLGAMPVTRHRGIRRSVLHSGCPHRRREPPSGFR